MALVTDIVRSHGRPREVFGAILKRGVDDKTGFFFLIIALVMGFVSQLPGVSRRANLPDPALEAAIAQERDDVRPIQGAEVPEDMVDAKFAALMSAELMVWLFILPLVFYGLAMVGHFAARALGGAPSTVASRVAMFWALLVATPLKLLHGLVFGMIGPGPALTLVGLLWLVLFMWTWTSNLRVAGWDQ